MTFLLDANLPAQHRMPFWHNSRYTPVPDRLWSDDTIWRYAKAQQLDVVVTRDADFERIVGIQGTPPKVVKLNLGRRDRSAIRELLRPLWQVVELYCVDPNVEVVVVTEEGLIYTKPVAL